MLSISSARGLVMLAVLVFGPFPCGAGEGWGGGNFLSRGARQNPTTQ